MNLLVHRLDYSQQKWWQTKLLFCLDKPRAFIYYFTESKQHGFRTSVIQWNNKWRFSACPSRTGVQSVISPVVCTRMACISKAEHLSKLHSRAGALFLWPLCCNWALHKVRQPRPRCSYLVLPSPTSKSSSINYFLGMSCWVDVAPSCLFYAPLPIWKGTLWWDAKLS